MVKRSQIGKPEFRYIPEGSQKLASRKSSAVVYLYMRAERPLAIGYVGKAVKPAFHWSFKSAAQRLARVAVFLKNCDESAEAAVKRQAEKREKMAGGHKLAVGSILRSSWGYDQTNIDYYQVVEQFGKRGVVIRKIAGGEVGGPEEQMHGDRGYCVPVPGAFLEGKEPLRKIVGPSGDSVKIASYASAYLVEPIVNIDGAKVWPRSYWSSYA